MFLSKSDFKTALDCPAKLWYKKHGYPTLMDNNEYMEMLADGGYMVGKMAQLLYEGGIVIEGNTEDCIKQTEELLQQENVVLFEPAISINNKLIRIDVLVKKGNKFELIEVKSKSIDGERYDEEQDDYFKSAWDPYIQDVAYQKLVLQEKFPKAKIDSFLLLPDKAKSTKIEGLINWFQLQEVKKTKSFRSVEVLFSGDVEQLRKDHILRLVKLNDLVQACMPMVKEKAAEFLEALLAEERIATQISIACKACEYRVNDEEYPKSGFETCWGKLAKVVNKKGEELPHILELGQLGNLNRASGISNGINNLIEEGKVAIKDIPEYYFYKDDGTPRYNARPLYQATRTDEFLLPEFKSEVEGIEYPLFFIDFETSQMAIPYHANMRPYQKVLFQWSCHVLREEGGTLEHYEWINTEQTYPNMEFLQTLKNLIGTKGTILTWSAYENSQFKMMIDILENTDAADGELLQWLNQITHRHAGDTSMIVDMNKLALYCYFHPIMGGRTSIKVTLPAVLASTKSDKIKNYLKAESLLAYNEQGQLINPYKLLPQVGIIEQAEYVADGSGAMRAYQDMLYGKNAHNAEIKQAYKQALLKYCKLDTLAMVVIWEHWKGMSGKK